MFVFSCFHHVMLDMRYEKIVSVGLLRIKFYFILEHLKSVGIPGSKPLPTGLNDVCVHQPAIVEVVSFCVLFCGSNLNSLETNVIPH